MRFRSFGREAPRGFRSWGGPGRSCENTAGGSLRRPTTRPLPVSFSHAYTPGQPDDIGRLTVQVAHVTLRAPIFYRSGRPKTFRVSSPAQSACDVGASYGATASLASYFVCCPGVYTGGNDTGRRSGGRSPETPSDVESAAASQAAKRPESHACFRFPAAPGIAT